MPSPPQATPAGAPSGAASATSDHASGSWVRRHAADLLVALVVLAAAAPTVQLLMAHQGSRLAFTAAVVDDATLVVDRYGPGLLDGRGPRESGGILQVDYAIRDGRLYSDKAPGQPLLVAPFYALARAVGAEPGISCTVQPAPGASCLTAVDPDTGERGRIRYFDNYTLWWTSLWSSAIPAAALAVMMRRFCLRITGDPRASAVAAVGLSLGSLLLPFATVLFSHVLAALLCYGCYVLAEPEDASNGRLAWAGALGGLAVLTEYVSAIVVVVVGVLILRRRWPGLVPFASGGLPSAVVLGVYNAVAWGDPLSFSYDHSGGFGDFHAQGVYGISLPDPLLTLEILVGERGLLTLTPVVAAGVVGLVLLARERATRSVGVVGLVVFGLFVCVQGGWFSVTAGASPGPRYVVAALPFVAVGVAHSWQRARGWVLASIGVGTAVMFAAIFTNPLAQPRPFEQFAAGHWVWRIISGRFGDTLLTPLVGKPWGQLLQLALVAALVVVLAQVVRRDADATVVLPADQTA